MANDDDRPQASDAPGQPGGADAGAAAAQGLTAPTLAGGHQADAVSIDAAAAVPATGIPPVDDADDDDPVHRPEEVGPTEVSDPFVLRELQRAVIWFGVGSLLALVVVLIQPILLILFAVVLAAMFDGGTRLLERVLPIGRGWRLAIVIIGATAFLVWVVMLAGDQLAAQYGALQKTIAAQVVRLGDLARAYGIAPAAFDLKALAANIMGSMGRVTTVVSNALGAVTSAAMVLVLAIFIAIEPRLYERGVAWMLPLRTRDHFYGTTARMGSTLRRLMAGRLLGMAVEGVGTWLLLWAGGVPMAALLGILTGLLAFIPNIGAIVSGALLILVGFSAGTTTGLFAIGVYVFVQVIDGYLIVPLVAKKSVDLAPALVLAAQILFGTLFGIVGLALADPIIAMIKVALEREAERKDAPGDASLSAAPLTADPAAAAQSAFATGWRGLRLRIGNRAA